MLKLNANWAGSGWPDDSWPRILTRQHWSPITYIQSEYIICLSGRFLFHRLHDWTGEPGNRHEQIEDETLIIPLFVQKELSLKLRTENANSRSLSDKRA